MYHFYYDVLKPKYGDNVELGYTDTDSFVIYVKTDDIYEDLKQLNEYMDFQIILKIIQITMPQIRRSWENSKMK